jgi:hypothetical protein
VQLYLADPVATVVRPVRRLVSFTRVSLEPGEAARVTFELSTDLAAFTGIAGPRVLEPGELRFDFGASSTDIRGSVSVRLVGDAIVFDDARDAARALLPAVQVTPVAARR